MGVKGQNSRNCKISVRFLDVFGISSRLLPQTLHLQTKVCCSCNYRRSLQLQSKTFRFQQTCQQIEKEIKQYHNKWYNPEFTSLQIHSNPHYTTVLPIKPSFSDKSASSYDRSSLQSKLFSAKKVATIPSTNPQTTSDAKCR